MFLVVLDASFRDLRCLRSLLLLKAVWLEGLVRVVSCGLGWGRV